jgi:hypothetical protein
MGSVRAGAGHATDEDGRAAGRFALADATDALAGEPAVVYVFASSEYDTDAVFDGIEQETDAVITGCTTAGEIVDTGSYTESVAVLALAGDGVDAATAGREYGDDAAAAARDATAAALSGLGSNPIVTDCVDDDDGWQSYPRLVNTVFGDYEDEGSGDVVPAVGDLVGSATVHGGLAADDWKYDGSARVIADGVYERGLAVTAVELDVKSGVGVRHGIEPTDTTFEITGIEGDTITEFDGEPALDAYERAVGPQVTNDQFRITAPLGFDAGTDEPRIHVAYAIDEAERTLSMTGGSILSVGDVGRLMDPTGEDVVRGAEQAIEAALSAAGEPDDVAAVMVHDCLCRWFFLSNTESRERELDRLREHVGEDVPIVGWYTAGEFRSPDTLDGTYDQTMVVWVITNESL